MSNANEEGSTFTKEAYADAYDDKYGYVDVPILPGTAENLAKYGHLVRDFDAEEVMLETWPQPGRRKIMKGTGRSAGIIEADFRMWCDGEYMLRDNVGAGVTYCGGRLPQGMSLSNMSHVLARDANYHPDGGQVFFPKSRDPFVALLALPGDDVTPADFRAFYFEGGTGFQIKPFVWHQAPYSAVEEVTFRNKQSSNYACVEVDILREFGKFLRVPMGL